MKRLAALMPAPYSNTIRYYGVFANRSKYRPLLSPPPVLVQASPSALAMKIASNETAKTRISTAWVPESRPGIPGCRCGFVVDVAYTRN
jgi:hypothetical protein